MATEEDLVIGIDLGTTNSCGACATHGEIRVIENKEGNFTTPSFVYFTSPKQYVVGQQAFWMSGNKPEYGVYEIKRFMGRPYNAKELKRSLKNLPFKVIEKNGSLAVQILDHDLLKTPEEISSLILETIKSDATVKLGQDIKKAVITVPPHFTVSQRKATLKAAELAGFTVLKLLSEPTAAALNYFFDAKEKIELDNKHWLVYDMGGGTFDVTIAKTTVVDDKQQINILCVDGNSNLGGHDFDKLIVNYFRDSLPAFTNKGTILKPRELRRATNACIQAKHTLATIEATEIRIEGFLNEEYIAVPFTRQTFDKICFHLFQKSIHIVDRCIEKSGIKKEDIDEILLAGGSTRIVKIQELLTEYFDGKTLNKMLHPELCVARGAALQAAMLSKNPKQKQKIDQVNITEVTSCSLGISDVANKMEFIIEKNTIIPTSGSITYITIKDKQQELKLDVYEGENINATRNGYLGTLRITNLTPLPPGKCRVVVTMNIDINGILTVTATEEHKHNQRDLEIALVRDNAVYTETNEEDNDKFEVFAELKSYFVRYCEGVLFTLRSDTLKNSHQSLWIKCEETQKELIQLDSVNDLGRLTELGKEVMRLCKPLVASLNSQDMPSISDKIKDVIKLDSNNEVFVFGVKM